MIIRIVLPITNHGSVSPQTKKSIDALVRSGIAEFEYSETKSAYVSKSRNFGIAEGCEYLYQEVKGIDYVLQMDADMEFSIDAVKKLIAADKDVICAAYQRRDHLDQMVAGAWSDTEGLEFLPWLSMGLQKVDFTGSGLQLIKASVFGKMKYPWFNFRYIEVTPPGDKTKAYEVGEDIGFAMKCKEAGIDIYVDCDNKVKHLTDWNGHSMENPQNTGVDLKSFLMYQNGKIDAIKSSINDVFNDFAKNIDELAKENESLKAKLAELQKEPEKPKEA